MATAEEKLTKVIDSALRALESISVGNKRLAIGDINFILENAFEAKTILEIELEDEE